MIYQVMCFDGADNLKVKRLSAVDRKEMQDIPGDLNTISSLSLLRDYITSRENE
ncbi:MAG: hypothetical protein KAR21_22410 [Spirochaetales bacterium]|nr:hypothetical protein [Spirochaetales bacterium]